MGAVLPQPLLWARAVLRAGARGSRQLSAFLVAVRCLGAAESTCDSPHPQLGACGGWAGGAGGRCCRSAWVHGAASPGYAPQR